MTSVFLSRGAWVAIPIVASAICAIGLLAAVRIIHITRAELHSHERDRYAPVAKYLHTNAHFRSRVLGLIMTAGILVTLPTVIIPVPSPPTTGWWLCFWINHYVVGTTSLYLGSTAVRSLNARTRGTMQHV